MHPLDIRCLISGKDTQNAAALFEEIVPPGGGPPRHTHRNQLEIFHVVDGTFRFEIDGQIVERSGGEVAVVPQGAVHAFRNLGATPGILHFQLLPAASSEAAFAELVSTDLTTVDMRALFDRYDMDLAGPPLEA